MGPRSKRDRGFTLVEVLVAVAILGLILLLVASQIDLTGKTYKRTVSKMEEYRAARLGFEAMSRRLSQATLASYLDLVDKNGLPPTATAYTGTPDHYARQSELRFICGNGLVPVVSTAVHPTHAVFFCAPLGMAEGLNPFNSTTSATATDQGLEQLLNVCGYYIEFNQDAALGDTPSFFPNAASARWRFRLMEMVEPSESIDIYAYTTNSTLYPYTATTWFTDGLPTSTTANTGFTHVLADNVIALIILPRLSTEQETQLGVGASALTTTYGYDSTASNGIAGYTLNQLPPVLQVTMVAIDETSALRLQAQFGAGTAPGLTTGLFTSINSLSSYTSDLSQLEANLQQTTVNGKTPAIVLKTPVSYRVFTSNIRITGARWSTDANN
jgi:uncharacterized protein (TIGR02599 family)